MKILKPFVSTFYSEHLLSPSAEEDGTHTTGQGIGSGYHAGLGAQFLYPGDPRKLREKSKVKLWKDYFKRIKFNSAPYKSLALLTIHNFTDRKKKKKHLLFIAAFRKRSQSHHRQIPYFH
jgi:hypothetical protein